MKHLLMILAVALPLSSWAASGRAGSFSVAPALFYATSEYDRTEIGGGTGESSSLYYDLRLGYSWSNGMYAGAIYGTRGDGNGTNDFAETYMGASFGYSNDGWIAVLHYFISAEEEIGTNTSLTSGTGFGLDIGYMWSVNNTFSIGPQLSYRTFSYTKLDVAGTETDKDTSQAYTLPYIALGFSF